MARYKHYDLNQTKMIPLSYADQIVEGSFEYALNEIVEEYLDLSVFEHRYHNDETGRSDYGPAIQTAHVSVNSRSSSIEKDLLRDVAPTGAMTQRNGCDGS